VRAEIARRLPLALFAGGVLGTVVAGCALQPEPGTTLQVAHLTHLTHVTVEELGREWPLNVAEADVGCDGSARAPRLYVYIGGTKYALNGLAMHNFEYLDLAKGRTADGRPLWKDAPPGGAGPRIGTGALQNKARDCCHP
jgi:hypothetical protein